MFMVAGASPGTRPVFSVEQVQRAATPTNRNGTVL
jgi:hypothetical protein